LFLNEVQYLFYKNAPIILISFRKFKRGILAVSAIKDKTRRVLFGQPQFSRMISKDNALEYALTE